MRAFPRLAANQGDRATNGPVARLDPQVSAQRNGRTQVQGSRATEQAGPLCSEAVRVVADRCWQVAQAATLIEVKSDLPYLLRFQRTLRADGSPGIPDLVLGGCGFVFRHLHNHSPMARVAVRRTLSRSRETGTARGPSDPFRPFSQRFGLPRGRVRNVRSSLPHIQLYGIRRSARSRSNSV